MARNRWLPLLAVALIVGFSLAVVGLTRGDDTATPTSTSVISDAVVDQFLEDFEASLTETFTVRSTFQRLRGEEVVSNADVTVIQRLPDRLTIRDGAISGVLDGRPVTCTDGECLGGSATIDIEADVATQVETMREYVNGVDLLYGVSAVEATDVTRLGGEDDRCYNLELLRVLPVAPYGTLGQFCFDPTTGAPTLLRIERPEAIDLTTATAVTATVTDADLTLPG